MPTGWPPASTSTALQYSRRATTSETVSPIPTIGSAGSMTSPTGRSSTEGSWNAFSISGSSLTVPEISFAASGCSVVAVSPSAPAALAGLALGGLGISLNAPIVFGIAGRRGRNRAAAISTVTTIGYVGLLVGPPLMGGLAQVASLRLSFAVLAGIAVLVSAAALRLRL